MRLIHVLYYDFQNLANVNSKRATQRVKEELEGFQKRDPNWLDLLVQVQKDPIDEVRLELEQLRVNILLLNILADEHFGLSRGFIQAVVSMHRVLLHELFDGLDSVQQSGFI